jgi:DNA invertase Pin-like site-specific DNA recombinase
MSKKEILHIYRRVSTNEQTNKYSLGNQLESGIKKAKELGMGYQDWNEEGVSGSSEKIEDREVLQELYLKLQLGEIKNLYVFDLSRLSRNPMVSSHLRKELGNNEVKLYTNESDVDFKSDEQVLMYDFFSSINQFFVRVQRKKSMMGKVSHFKKGGWRGGTFPFGYESKKINGMKQLVINPSESVWVRKIYELYDKDIAVKEIGKLLDKNDIKPRRGKFWSGASILVILKNELYLGKDEMIDRISNPSKPELLYFINKELQLIDDETFNRVQNRRQLKLKRRNQITKVKHNEVLFRGLLFCEDCGEIYGCRVKPSKNENYYYCRSRENNWRKIDESKKVDCNVKKSLNIKNTDEQVWNILVEILSTSHIIKETIKSKVLANVKMSDLEREEKVVQLKKKINYIKGKISELEIRETENREWYLTDDIDKKKFEAGKLLIQETKTKRFSELENLSMKIHSIEDEKKWISWLDKHQGWIDGLKDNYSLEEKKEVVNEYVLKVLVDFDTAINQHKLKIYLKLPIVNDIYKKLEGRGNYEILSGLNNSEIMVKGVKAGRKKKLKTSEIPASSGEEKTPPIKETTLR